MNYLADVFLNSNWFIKLIIIVLLTIFLSGMVCVISAVSFLSTVLNLPGLIVLALSQA